MYLFLNKLFNLSLCFVFLFLPVYFCHADSNCLLNKDVQLFIQEMVKIHQFKKPYLFALFNKVKLRPQVMARLTNPPEKRPWHTYQILFVNKWRVKEGLKFWKKYEIVLAQAEKIFGVPASLIVATIGVETKYGARKGKYRVIDSLSSLAFSLSPRARYFRKELEAYLLLTREQHLDPLQVLGSYAGAIGQPQFMPSSYRMYAINFSNSGKIDLINNEIDIIGSVANYYQKHGWERDHPIVEQASILGSGFSYLIKKNKLPLLLSMSQLAEVGVIPKKINYPQTTKVKIIELESKYSKEYWLGFHNFDVIKRYNSSDLYAMAVFQLSSYLKYFREHKQNG